jgi:hypothetical protein
MFSMEKYRRQGFVKGHGFSRAVKTGFDQTPMKAQSFGRLEKGIVPFLPPGCPASRRLCETWDHHKFVVLSEAKSLP